MEFEPLLQWYELKQFISGFPGKTVAAHISLVLPETTVHVHRDGYGANNSHRPLFPMFNSTLRFHVPLKTNDESLIYCRSKFYRMKEGECWMLNNLAPHAAVNLDPCEKRYHLIFDVEPNHETMELIEESETDLGYEDEEIYSTYLSKNISRSA